MFPAENLKQARHFFGQLEEWLLVFLVSLLVLFSTLQIVLRNFFTFGLVWGDDLLRHGVLWLSFLGAARATAENKHIRIDLLPRFLPVKSRYIVDLVCPLFSCLVCIVLFWASWNFVQAERLAGDTVFAAIPFWWLETIFPFSFGLMALRFGFALLEGAFRALHRVKP